MARYNAWQNNWIADVVSTMPETELIKDRGAFFGSIHATLNHILWADRFWFYRLGLGDMPEVAPKDHVRTTPTITAWCAERAQMDTEITAWASDVQAADLQGDVIWRSALKGSEMRNPRTQCIVHMFNHQTHHRGQVHAMLTAAGQTTTDTDLLFMDVQ